MVSCWTATNPPGQQPVAASAKAMWLRWLPLSMFRPSQQLWKRNVRTTLLPLGHTQD
jgi:hypothetical protein